MKRNYIEILRIKHVLTHDTFRAKHILRKSYVRVVIALGCYLCRTPFVRNSNTPAHEDIHTTVENKIKLPVHQNSCNFATRRLLEVASAQKEGNAISRNRVTIGVALTMSFLDCR